MEILKAIMAFIPMIWLLISLGVLKIPTHKACLWAVIITAALALFVFDMKAIFLGEAVIEGAIYALVSICCFSTFGIQYYT